MQVYTVHSRPNYTLPWQNHPKRESTGTGFVVHDRLILTNAHVVADSTYVLVKRHGSGTKYRAGQTTGGGVGSQEGCARRSAGEGRMLQGSAWRVGG